MAKNDKDLGLKRLALRYSVSNDWMPFLEVNLKNPQQLSDREEVITDLDVVGVHVQQDGQSRRIIFDCKTQAKVSPVNRAFWAAGAAKFISASEAFVVLQREASESHRLSGIQIGVQLFSEKQFVSFAETTHLGFSSEPHLSGEMTGWQTLFDAVSRPTMSALGDYLRSDAVLDTSEARVLRRLLGLIRSVRGEFDPAKKNDRAVFLYCLSIAVFSLSRMIPSVSRLVAWDWEEKQFAKVLRYYVWGGREAYEMRSKIREKTSLARGEDELQALELWEWERFIELCRKLLEEPGAVRFCNVPSIEMALWECGSENEEAVSNLARKVRSHPRIRQVMLRVASYIVEACGLPKEFLSLLQGRFEKLDRASVK